MKGIDDFFLVLKGRLIIRLRDRAVVLGPGELFVVPRGVEHQPGCPSLAWVLAARVGGLCGTRPPFEAPGGPAS
jgi:hypothetical protein